MSTRAKGTEAPRARRGWRRATIGLAVAAVLLAAGAAWLRGSGPDVAAAGTPRLAVDRTEVDLGYRRYDSPARVAFRLTNDGDAPLRLTEVPRVKAVQGC